MLKSCQNPTANPDLVRCNKILEEKGVIIHVDKNICETCDSSTLEKFRDMIDNNNKKVIGTELKNITEFGETYEKRLSKITSVIITNRNDEFINKTIESLLKSSSENIEIIVINDGPTSTPVNTYEKTSVISFDKPVGRRKGINEASKIAIGDYLFILDAHCIMSDNWDSKLKASCPENGIIVSSIYNLNRNFEPSGSLGTHVYLSKDFKELWWDNFHNSTKALVEPMMTFTGCAWMITKKYFNLLGGYDESLGEWGGDGCEWTLKTIFDKDNSGEILLNKDVKCGHVFYTNLNKRTYITNKNNKFSEIMWERYGDRIYELVDKFHPVPSWYDVPEVSISTNSDRIKNFTKAVGRRVWRTLKGYTNSTNPEEAKRRLSICTSCGKYDNGFCPLCGCHMPTKVGWAGEWCNLGKWGVPNKISTLLLFNGNVDNDIKLDLLKNTSGDVDITVDTYETNIAQKVNSFIMNSVGEYICIFINPAKLTFNWDKLFIDNYVDGSILLPTKKDSSYYKKYLSPSLEYRDAGEFEIYENTAVVYPLAPCFFAKKHVLSNLGGFQQQGIKELFYTELGLKVNLAGNECILVKDVNYDSDFIPEINQRIFDRNALKVLQQSVYNGTLPNQKYSIDWLAGKFNFPNWNSKFCNLSTNNNVISTKETEIFVERKVINE